MKKIVGIAAATLLLAGCSSGVSQESYNSLEERNATLVERVSSRDSEIYKLEAENRKLKSEYEQLELENEGLMNGIIPTGKLEDVLKCDIFTKSSNVKEVVFDSTKHKLYYNGTNVFVSYIEDNYLNVLPDDLIAQGAVLDTALCAQSVSPDISAILIFVCDKKGNIAAAGNATIEEPPKINLWFRWCGEYERLNSYSEQIIKELSPKAEQEPSNSSENTSSSVSEPVHAITTGERNAVKKARSYLEFSAFSYTGLISQLEFEGFSTSEATYGADNCGADWNEQAAKKAKSYLEFSSFSRSGLIEQLEFEGFTHSQAEYGVSQNGY